MRGDAFDDGTATIAPSSIVAHDGVPLPYIVNAHSVFVNGAKLGSGLFGHIPAGKYQNSRVALQHARQDLGPLDAQIDGVSFNG